jgi:hypothetical protein
MSINEDLDHLPKGCTVWRVCVHACFMKGDERRQTKTAVPATPAARRHGDCQLPLSCYPKILPPILRTLSFSGNSSSLIRPTACIWISQQRQMSGYIFSFPTHVMSSILLLYCILSLRLRPFGSTTL